METFKVKPNGRATPHGYPHFTRAQSVLKSNFKIEILVLLTLFFDASFISRQTLHPPTHSLY
jgi:hypothetical protein